ncbi:uncharacterized protein LOC120351644 [Nilaparvata lugens]|uniref:uncharacterized protein LOC120351644 n=1 Tax=Nilaparvata lugens TaxID=108931 RepID=UPI00193E5EFF|nr:uncharacterized protein LOC120351644 [Nilaparvata lugens]
MDLSTSPTTQVRTDFRSAPQPNVTPAERLMIDRGATVVRPGNARRSNIFRNVHDGCAGGATVVRWRTVRVRVGKQSVASGVQGEGGKARTRGQWSLVWDAGCKCGVAEQGVGGPRKASI